MVVVGGGGGVESKNIVKFHLKLNNTMSTLSSYTYTHHNFVFSTSHQYLKISLQQNKVEALQSFNNQQYALHPSSGIKFV